MLQQNVTGTPRWDLARESVARLREMPAQQAEANVEDELVAILRALFPNLSGSELMSQKPAGGGRIDVYCRNAVFEVKAPGKLDARVKPDGATETPEEQAVRYLNALTVQPNMFNTDEVGWRAGTTDGKEWFFYDYNPDPAVANEQKLTLVNALRLDTLSDGEALLSYLYDFINRTVKRAPPTDNVEWANQQVQPFLELAAGYENSPEYEVKHALWRGVLAGAFISPRDDTDAARDLFARHTMLVVIARAVAETIKPAMTQPEGRDILRDRLTRGFAAWLLDAAGDDGTKALDALVAEVNNYEWRAANRDTLKDLYHAVIPRDIRHDFGEYYTPDWLARAVCEEVMDPEWRRDVIDNAVAGQLDGPAVLDPSSGSGTFLYHATQLLLESARQHPELAGSPQAQVEVVNDLVAGMDLHPVAVELSKTTKILAFNEMASYASSLNAELNVHLGDSLQWETRRNRGTLAFGDMVDIPTYERNNPIRLPSSLMLSEHFPQLLAQIFDYANRPDSPGTEDALLSVLHLPNAPDRDAVITLYRRFREYIADGRNNVWHWYIANRIQPLRLASLPTTRMVGNPPWVVYNAMSGEQQDGSDSEQDNSRQGIFRLRAAERNLWAGAHLATQNDLAATFVATCVDYYLQTGGKFGFVLPYAALRARHWANFRTGNWSLQQDAEQGTHVDLSVDAWDFYGVNAPPFPQANSSVVFGTKVRADDQNPQLKPLDKIRQQEGAGIDTKMSWDDVRPLLTYTYRKQYPVAPSPVYADAFRNGATLFPQPLVVFEEPTSRALGKVYFKTNAGKSVWKGKEREGQVEERFVRPALFSRSLLPFGTTGNSHVIAPFSTDGSGLTEGTPSGADAARFRLYWDNADRDWREGSGGRPPHTLVDRLNYSGGLVAQLRGGQSAKVVYQRSGSWLQSCVTAAHTVADGTLNWYASDNDDELHYLSAIFNAPCLADFFKDACRASDRHFQMGPIENLPIPAYDAGNEHHANLAAQSRLAHELVDTLLAERSASSRRINRNDVLRDGAMQPILASIDESVRAILPDYCA